MEYNKANEWTKRYLIKRTDPETQVVTSTVVSVPSQEFKEAFVTITPNIEGHFVPDNTSLGRVRSAKVLKLRIKKETFEEKIIKYEIQDGSINSLTSSLLTI